MTRKSARCSCLTCWALWFFWRKRPVHRAGGYGYEEAAQ